MDSTAQGTNAPRLAYLHGLGSGPGAYKGTRLRERLRGEVELELPDLNRPSLERLSPLQGLRHLEAMTAGGRWSLIASSYGGWLGALLAVKHPDRVERLVLLCPAFDLAGRWPHLLGEEAMAAWEATGALPLESGGTLPWSFLEESRALDPRPAVSQPTWIVHGRNDEVVPHVSSETYAAALPNVSLVSVDDDHGLAASVDVIERLVRAQLLAPSSPSLR